MTNQGNIILIERLEEMLQFYSLIEHLGYPESLEAYQKLLKPMIDRGYAQIIYYVNNEAIALAGFWVNTKLFSGKYIDVDNVIVAPKHRGLGVGALLMKWIEEHAKQIEAKMIVLDAFLESRKAHQFYFKQGYVVKGFHFTKDV